MKLARGVGTCKKCCKRKPLAPRADGSVGALCWGCEEKAFVRKILRRFETVARVNPRALRNR